MLFLDGSTTAVYALAFSPDGRLLAAGDKDGTVWLWDEAGERRTLLTGSGQPKKPVQAVEFRPGGEEVLVGGVHGWLSLRTTDTADGRPLIGWQNLGPGVTAIKPVAAGLVGIGFGSRIGPEGGEFSLFDLAADRPKPPRFPAPQGVRAVAALPDRKLVAWAEWGRRACVWDIAKPDRTLIPLAAEPMAVALHPYGTVVAVAVDYAVRAFDIASKQERVTFKEHTGKVTAIGYTPDGRTLATGSWDKTVRLWDAASGHCRATFDWPGGRVYALAIAPDGLRLAAAGETGQVVVIDLE